MKLLICTQVVDRNHPILGFFHRWIEEFSKHCETVHVIALEVGEYDLPENVYVYSLGKEEEAAYTLVYAWRLNRLAWRLRKEYDTVFTHMNPEYVLAGGFWWRLLRKRHLFWYTHGSVSWRLRIAQYFVDTIFTASPEGCRLSSKKVWVTGHGIDTDHFRSLQQVEKDLDLVTVGRITSAKNLETLITILSKVREHHDVSLTIVGTAGTETERRYLEALHATIKDAGLTEQVHFYGSCPQEKLPQLLNRANVFVTAATNGSLDKAVLEAMACGVPTVSMAPGTVSLPLGECQVADQTAAAAVIDKLLTAPQQSLAQQLVLHVRNHHSLAILAQQISHFNDDKN